MNIKILKTSIAAGTILAMFAGLAWAQEQKAQAVHYTVTDLGLVGSSPARLLSRTMV